MKVCDFDFAPLPAPEPGDLLITTSFPNTLFLVTDDDTDLVVSVQGGITYTLAELEHVTVVTDKFQLVLAD